LIEVQCLHIDGIGCAQVFQKTQGAPKNSKNREGDMKEVRK
jgi:hypothetical protein